MQEETGDALRAVLDNTTRQPDREGDADQVLDRTAEGSDGSKESEDNVGAGRGCSSRAAVGTDGGAASAGGTVAATAKKQTIRSQQKGSADTQRRREFDMAGSWIMPSKTECM